MRSSRHLSIDGQTHIGQKEMYIPGSEIQPVSVLAYKTTTKPHYDRQYQFTYIHFPNLHFITTMSPHRNCRPFAYTHNYTHVTIGN